MSWTARQNEGLKAYQEKQRAETIRKIDEAIVYLREKKLKVSKTSIADEIGVHRNTLSADYVLTHLSRYAEFNPDVDKTVTQALNYANAENIKLQEKVHKQMTTISHLKQENDKLRLSNREIDDKYKRLLGRYQTDMSNKVISFK